MKTKLFEKLDTIIQMVIFYLCMLCLTFIIALVMGRSVGRIYLPYSLMSRCMLHMGIFSLCLTIFLSDLFFAHLKNWVRLLLCILAGFIYIEGFTLYSGYTSTDNPAAYLFANQMLFLEFIFLLIGWGIYSKLSSHHYQNLLALYQKEHLH